MSTLLNHELRCPYLSGVDVLCSYIKQPGLAHLLPSLAALPASVAVRVVTTTQHQLTEPAALRTLATLRNVAVRVVVADSPTCTRAFPVVWVPSSAKGIKTSVSSPGHVTPPAADHPLRAQLVHAKSWLFRRPCPQPAGHGAGCACRYVAVVGSSNLSKSALTQGIEWNVRVVGTARTAPPDGSTAAWRPVSAVEQFASTFNQYWNGADRFWGNEDNVVAFDPTRPGTCELVYARLRRRDASSCEDPGCAECLAHARHLQDRQRQRSPGARIAVSRAATSSSGQLAVVAHRAAPSRPAEYYPAESHSLSPAQAHPIPAAAVASNPSPQLPGATADEMAFLAFYAAAHGYAYDWLWALPAHHRERRFGLESGTLLHAAAYGLHLPLLEALLARGADVHAADAHGNTPLHRAVQSSPYVPHLTQGNGGGDGGDAAAPPYAHARGREHFDLLLRVVRCLAAHGARGADALNGRDLPAVAYGDALLAEDGRRVGALRAAMGLAGEAPPAGAVRVVLRAHGYGDGGGGAAERRAAGVALFEALRYPRWEEWDELVDRLNGRMVLEGRPCPYIALAPSYLTPWGVKRGRRSAR